MMGKEKMMGLMMDMCCKGMSEEDRQKMKNICKDIAESFPACCKTMDFSSFIEHCSSRSVDEKPQA